jgi:hypothetical protein
LKVKRLWLQLLLSTFPSPIRHVVALFLNDQSRQTLMEKLEIINLAG